MNARLREARENLGLTIKDAAEQAGVSKGTWVRAEAGDAELHAPTKHKIARSLSGRDGKPLQVSDLWPRTEQPA